jgi:large subunit ribosomal protein L33
MKSKKKKSARVLIIIECAECSLNQNKRSTGVSRYHVSKNRKNTPEKLEISKHCRFCNRHTTHKEIK